MMRSEGGGDFVLCAGFYFHRDYRVLNPLRDVISALSVLTITGINFGFLEENLGTHFLNFPAYPLFDPNDG